MTRRPTAAVLRDDSFQTAAETAVLTILTTLAVAGTMLIAAVPHASGQGRQSDDTVIQTSVSGTPDGPQESYRARVRDEMADWRQKMQAFDEKMETRSKGHIDAAERRLRAAWDDTEVEARNVQTGTATATAKVWERTKRAYEAASHRMAMAWDKARS